MQVHCILYFLCNLQTLRSPPFLMLAVLIATSAGQQQQEQSNRPRRMSLLHENPVYTSMDTSPFHQAYTSRIPKSIGNFNFNPNGFKGSQDFNVGYSLNLGGGAHGSSQPQSTLEYSDIITGSPKLETGRKPSFNVDASTKLLGESNVTPDTQKYFSALSSGTKSWQNISPNIEISQSKEIQIGQNSLSSFNHFDHQKAIGKSQGFDFSNVVDGQNQQQDFFKQPSSFGISGATTVSLGSPKNPSSIDLTNYQQSSGQFDSSYPQLEATFQNTPKFPLDTHLLKEAGISTSDPKSPGLDSLPVQIDTSIIDKFKTNTESLLKTPISKEQPAQQELMQMELQFQQQQASQQQNAHIQAMQMQFQKEFQQLQQQQQQQKQHFQQPQAQQKPRVPQFQQHQQQQPQFQQPQQFKKKPSNPNQLVNFKDQKMLHFDNGNPSGYSPNLNTYGSIQKVHGFRKSRYNLDLPPRTPVGGPPTKGKKNYAKPQFGMNFDLRPPPPAPRPPRYRTKTKRFF